MRIEYSPVAVRDLERVWAEVFEASASEETATKYVDDLMNQISAKQNFPKSGAPLPLLQTIFKIIPTNICRKIVCIESHRIQLFITSTFPP